MFIVVSCFLIQHVTNEGTTLVKQAEDAASNKKVGLFSGCVVCVNPSKLNLAYVINDLVTLYVLNLELSDS